MMSINKTRFAALAIALAMVFGAVAIAPSTALANDWDSYGLNEVGGWDSYGYDNSGWDSYGYDSGWDSYGYDSGWDSYGYDNNNWDSYGYDSGWDSYGYDNDYELYGNDYELYGNDYELYGNDYELYGNDYELYGNDYELYGNDYELYGNDYEIYKEYFADDYYQEQYQQQYQAQSFAQQQFTQAMSYVPPQYRPQTPSYPVFPQTPHYPAPVPPRPQPPVPQPPVVIPPPVNNTNINTCTHYSCNTTNTNINNIDNSIVDNSINGSFNSTVLTQPNPQPIVQYTYPQYIPQYPTTQAPYCVITVSQGISGMTVLSWTSQYATSATISPLVGQVAPNGSTQVYAMGSNVYTLTVYGPGGSYICRTQAPIAQSPYVSLTQIPYTGLDLGPIGNAMYWTSLLALAVAGAYLLVYYKGGVLALAGQALSTRVMRSEEVETTEETTPVESPVQLSNLPTQSNSRDAIRMTRDANGQPRLVISRS